MALARDVVAEGLLDDLERFEALLRTLGDDEWNAPSRCEGWTVGDVARHAIGSLADAVAGRLDGLGSPEVTQREVDERAGRSPAEIADEVAEVRQAAAALVPTFDDATWNAPAPGSYDGTLGDGIEAFWYDFWLHADDIRAATGRTPEIGKGIVCAVNHVGFEARKRGWQGDTPTPDDEDAHRWVLAMTGRAPLKPGEIDIYADR